MFGFLDRLADEEGYIVEATISSHILPMIWIGMVQGLFLPTKWNEFFVYAILFRVLVSFGDFCTSN